MTLQEFTNNLRILRSIDGYELPGLAPDLVRKFIGSPYETFIRMSDDEREAVWDVITRRQPKKRRHQAEPGVCAYCDSEREKGHNFHPPHDASPNCQSGKHPHCSCDMCF